MRVPCLRDRKLGTEKITFTPSILPRYLRKAKSFEDFDHSPACGAQHRVDQFGPRVRLGVIVVVVRHGCLKMSTIAHGFSRIIFATRQCGA